MTGRIRLTAAEIDAVLEVAGNALAPETFDDPDDPARAARRLAAYERGVDKLMAIARVLRDGVRRPRRGAR